MHRFFFLLVCSFFSLLGGYQRPAEVEERVWNKLESLFLPEDHPIKENLDAIFSKGRPTFDEKSMRKAGFAGVHVRHYTKLVACKHPLLPGFLVKTFLDTIEKNQPEHHYWMKRIAGANVIRNYITAHELDHFFKVPQKWIYPLPPSGNDRNFVLIVEDMGILNEQDNEMRWGSDHVSQELLEELFHLVTELGFWDCTKPENIPFCQDGKVAFVDTENRYSQKVRYHKLTPLLNPGNREFWKCLIACQKDE